jgi:hypothetical protein
LVITTETRTCDHPDLPSEISTVHYKSHCKPEDISWGYIYNSIEDILTGADFDGSSKSIHPKVFMFIKISFWIALLFYWLPKVTIDIEKLSLGATERALGRSEEG